MRDITRELFADFGVELLRKRKHGELGDEIFDETPLKYARGHGVYTGRFDTATGRPVYSTSAIDMTFPYVPDDEVEEVEPDAVASFATIVFRRVREARRIINDHGMEGWRNNAAISELNYAFHRQVRLLGDSNLQLFLLDVFDKKVVKGVVKVLGTMATAIILRAFSRSESNTIREDEGMKTVLFHVVRTIRDVECRSLFIMGLILLMNKRLWTKYDVKSLAMLFTPSVATYIKTYPRERVDDLDTQFIFLTFKDPRFLRALQPASQSIMLRMFGMNPADLNTRNQPRWNPLQQWFDDHPELTDRLFGI